MASSDPSERVQEVASALPSIQVERELVPGGQGEVFLVSTPAHGRGVLKIYRPDMLARADHEVAKLQRITSPYVVNLIGHGLVDLKGEQKRYAITQYIEGEDLADPQRPLDDADTLRFIQDVAQGIEALWVVRVVHRDLKPANIMRAANGSYVIIDLGFAKHLDDTSLTRSGFTCGTPGYMSPEQAAGRPGLTYKSDVFTLGIAAYELRCGYHPFRRNQLLIGSSQPEPLSTVVSASASLSSLVERMLATNPISRPTFRDIYEVCRGGI